MVHQIPELLNETSSMSESSPEQHRLRAADITGFTGIEEENKGLILKSKLRKASDPPAAFAGRQIA